jgi:hypothetical protein
VIALAAIHEHDQMLGHRLVAADKGKDKRCFGGCANGAYVHLAHHIENAPDAASKRG